MRGTKEMLDMMDAFEKACASPYTGYLGCKIERIDPNGRQDAEWPKDHFYTNSELNAKFKFFMMGFQSGKHAA